MAGSAGTKLTGFLLIGVYTLGFILPFLAVGLFTAKVLRFSKVQSCCQVYGEDRRNPDDLYGTFDVYRQDERDHRIFIGNSRNTDFLKRDNEKGNKEEKQDTYPATDFVLQDQYGKEHSLADYKGKTIFLNFWATWCGPCRNEMPEIQKIYEETQQEEDSDLVILGIAAPGFGQEGSQEEIEAFLEENGYTYPVLMDTTGEIFMEYGISAYPTTFMVDKDGNLFGYVQGQLNEDMMRSIIRQTMEGKRE